MLFKPTIGTDLSGKVGGIVASHNAGGAYFRAATIPTNPNTPQQNVVRAAVAQLTSLWQSSLGQVNRDAWDLYAANVPLTNRIGEQHNVSGLAMYVRSNVPRLQAGVGRIDIGPAVFNLGAYTAPTLSNASEAAQTIDVNFINGSFSDPWAVEVGGFMFSYFSRPQNTGINFFRGPYRFAATVEGEVIPPVSPNATAAPFAFVANQRIFGRHFTVRADGRLAAVTHTTVLTVA